MGPVPLFYVHHPSQQQQLEEERLLRERLGQLLLAEGLEDLPGTEPEAPTTEEEDVIDPIVECADILVRGLWDIFSDNHRVTTAEGREVDLGSFRLAAAFLTAFHDNPHAQVEEGVAFWRHSQFYPGSLGTRRRADCPRSTS